jgi:hypothetical protein
MHRRGFVNGFSLPKQKKKTKRENVRLSTEYERDMIEHGV